MDLFLHHFDLPVLVTEYPMPKNKKPSGNTMIPARHKHKVHQFNENDVGEVISFRDGSFKDKPMSGVMSISSLVNVKDFANRLSTSIFLLGVNPDKDCNKRLVHLIGELQKSPHQAAVLQYDKDGSEALLVPFTHKECKNTGYKCGFVGRIIGTSSIPLSMYDSDKEETKVKRPKNDKDNEVHSANPYAGIQSHVSSLLNPNVEISSFTSTNGYGYAYPPIDLKSGKNEIESIVTSTAAQGHYNQLKRDRETRHQSQLFHLRNINNFIKLSSIETVCRYFDDPRHVLSEDVLHACRGVKVLDLACGKGGDLHKWLKNPVGLCRYVGADIAEESLREFVEDRILNNATLTNADTKAYRKLSHLIHCNLSEDSLTNTQCMTHTWDPHSEAPRSLWSKMIPLTVEDTFHIISCQFAMHYMFSSMATAQHFFTQIAQHLAPGGCYLATTLDCRILVHYLFSGLYGPLQTAKENDVVLEQIAGFHCRISEEEKVVRLCLENEFGSRLLTIQLTQEMVDRLMANGDVFGIEYQFILQDKDDEKAVNAPEWMVPLGAPLNNLLASLGLRVKLLENFQEFVTNRSFQEHFRKKMEDMEVFNILGRLSDSEWNIARLYCVLVIEKIPSDEMLQSVETKQNKLFEPMPGEFVPHSPVHPPSFPPVSETRSQLLRQLVDFCARSSLRHSLDCPPSSPPRLHPVTPDYPPPVDREDISRVQEDYDNDNEFEQSSVQSEDEDDEYLMEIMRALAKAKELAGMEDDEESWDKLNDDEREEYLKMARESLAQSKNSANGEEGSPLNPYD